jgi:molybdopterin/thiamine biosynthesis adenylyltransferase
MASQVLSNQELRRYKKQIVLSGVGLPGQEKIKKSKVLVAGAGGIGSSALQYLAASGVGELGICDNTIIEEENFQNQVLYNSIDLGKHKAIIAKSKLEGLNSFIQFSIFNIFISSENALKICRNFDIVINATNDKQIGLVLDAACFQLQIPLIHAWKRQNVSRISVFNYQKGPGLADYLKLESYNKQNSDDNSDSGSFGVIDGIAGNIMAMEAIKIITGIGEVLCNRSLLIDPINLIIEYKTFN